MGIIALLEKECQEQWWHSNSDTCEGPFKGQKAGMRWRWVPAEITEHLKSSPPFDPKPDVHSILRMGGHGFWRAWTAPTSFKNIADQSVHIQRLSNASWNQSNSGMCRTYVHESVKNVVAA